MKKFKIKKGELIRRLLYLDVDSAAAHMSFKAIFPRLHRVEEIQRNHGQAHMAQDILPQFRDLCKKVEKLERTPSPNLNIAITAGHSKRIADLEETAAALSETVDQLSICKCEAGNQMLKRISEQGMDILELKKRWIEMDEGSKSMLKALPEIEILKVQMHNLLPVHNNMIDEILKQKVFLEKVQVILDRERDARIMKSAGYKKEIAAQEKEHMVMDKHLDTMVKKGRPKKAQ